MTFLAACLRADDASPAERICDSMLVAQGAPLGREGIVEGAFAAAAAVAPVLAGGDTSAFGPSPCGNWLLAIDARLTDRAALTDTLGIMSTSSRRLILEAWSRWGDAAPSRLSGSFAIVAWDRRARRLHLVRDQLGQRPLFYRTVPGGYAAASMPAGLLRPFGDAPRPDLATLNRLLNHSLMPDDASCYADVQRVRPGEIVTLSLDAPPTATTYWQPRIDPDPSLTAERCGEAFARLLPAAVADQIEPGRAAVVHLSAGLDSAAVAAWAQRVAAPAARIVAITAVPADGARITAPPGRIVDETALARAVSAVGDLEHHCVAAGAGFAGLLDDAHAALAQPVPSPHNYGWIASAFDLTRAHGIDVALTGQAGNLTFSVDGQQGLRESLRAGAWTRVVRQALDPSRLGARLARLTRGLVRSSGTDTAAWTLARHSVDDPAPARSAAEHSLAILRAMDPGALLRSFYTRWGVDMRDPTADLRVVECALRVPAAAMRVGDLDRAPARLALRGVVPEAVRLNRRRGYQAADWLDAMTAERATIAREVEALAGSAVARELIDVPRLQRLVADWPATMRYTPTVERLYRHVVPQAITVAGWARRVAGE